MCPPWTELRTEQYSITTSVDGQSNIEMHPPRRAQRHLLVSQHVTTCSTMSSFKDISETRPYWQLLA